MGLNAEVVSVSGANLGDLATTIAEHQEVLSKKLVDLVIVGGINDIVDRYENISDIDFEANMQLTIEKLDKAFDEIRFRTAYITQPLLDQPSSIEFEERISTCKRYLLKLENMKNVIKVVEEHNIFEKNDKVHPTEDLTKKFLESLQTQITKHLIRNKKLVSNKYLCNSMQTA